MTAGDDFKVDFSLSQIGHYGGPDEPGLARETSSGNIDRGINVTSGIDAVSGTPYDRFLILPSESAKPRSPVLWYRLFRWKLGEPGLWIWLLPHGPRGQTRCDPRCLRRERQSDHE